MEETTSDIQETIETAESDALQNALAEAEEQRNLYLRTLADFQNYRRRQQDALDQIRWTMVEAFVHDLLPILDNFDRALSAADEVQDGNSILEGVRLTQKQIAELLERFDIKPIEAVGKPFDPNLHDAVSRVESVDHQDGEIVEEIQRGYTIQDRVLRPSRVLVAKKSEQPIENGGIDTAV